VIKPLELLGVAHRRLALIAGARAASLWLVPALTALVVGAWFDSIAAATWGRLGYAMIGADAMRGALVIAGLAMLAGGAVHGWLAWRATGFVAAAAEVDDALNAHQEVLSLAALSGQAEPAETERGALFALGAALSYIIFIFLWKIYWWNLPVFTVAFVACVTVYGLPLFTRLLESWQKRLQLYALLESIPVPAAAASASERAPRRRKTWWIV